MATPALLQYGAPTAPASASLALRLQVRLGGSSLDRLLAKGEDPAESPLLGRRAEQLVSTKSRHELAHRLERIVDQAEDPPRVLSAAAPLGREAILGARAQLLALARDLRAVEPVGAAGVALAKELLVDGASPLYAPDGEEALLNAIEQASWGLLIAPRAGASTHRAVP
jgi:hypothetical protein